LSRNPFLDLGFPPEEAIALHIRSQLAAELESYIEKLSIEFLIKLMVRAGLPVSISGGRRLATRRPGPHRSTATA
jgi:hypothetical protein